MTIRAGIQNSAPSGRSWMPRRMIPKAPSFISTPAWSMLTAVGAATWPSGGQGWKGQGAAGPPQPKEKGGKDYLLEVLIELVLVGGRQVEGAGAGFPSTSPSSMRTS